MWPVRSLIVVAVLLAAPAWASAVVLLFPSLGTPAKVTLSGRVLARAPSKGTSVFGKNVRRLTVQNLEGAEVEIHYAGKIGKTRSVHDGNFAVTIDGPFEVGFGTAEARVSGAEVSVAVVQIVSTEAPFIVISDFDDTLAVTNVVDRTGMIRAAFLQDEKSQPVIEGMSAFYGCLQDDKSALPGFQLVSGSPVQFLSRVRDFLNAHRFPSFAISLRDLGPATLSGYKQPVIRALMKQLPNDVVLVGDSGEHDPEVYAQIRSEFPGRVKAIYIRNAGGLTTEKKRFEDMLLFATPKQAAEDAVTRGLMRPACLEKAFPPPVEKK